MALRGNYYFPLVYIVWEFHRRSFAFVSRVGIVSKNSRVIKRREEKRWDSFSRRILIAIPHGIYIYIHIYIYSY